MPFIKRAKAAVSQEVRAVAGSIPGLRLAKCRGVPDYLLLFFFLQYVVFLMVLNGVCVCVDDFVCACVCVRACVCVCVHVYVRVCVHVQ